jgi:hypothetical protein
MKKCSKCGLEKDFSCFNKRPESPSGYRGECKECKSLYDASLKEREKIEIIEKECNKCNQKKTLEEFHKLSSSLDGRRTMCKICSLENMKTYKVSPEAKKRAKERKRKYRQNPKVKENRNKKEKERYEKDIHYKLRLLISGAVNKAIKRQNNRKDGSTLKNLPYSMEDLKRHLEQQFDEKMNWENHGSVWHIDHIIPQSLLPYDSFLHPNFLKCWCLENLQPLYVLENLKKSNKIINDYLFKR